MLSFSHSRVNETLARHKGLDEEVVTDFYLTMHLFVLQIVHFLVATK